MSKNRILLLLTNHRVAEKIWPIVPVLSADYHVDVFRVGLFSKETPWIGNIDERVTTLNKYASCISSVIDGPGIRFHGDTVRYQLTDYINLDLYSFVIYDDNREMSEYGIPNFYRECKRRGIKVIANEHGNEDNPHNAMGVSYDHKITFQEGGIPANDTLAAKKLNASHLLVITNFLANRSSPFPINFDNRFVDNTGIKELAAYLNTPIKVKIKARLDAPDYARDVSYVKTILDCEVIVNSDDIDQLIADSAIVIAAPSTLCFKPIQLGIPTVMIRNAGATGLFKGYTGLVDLSRDEVYNSLEHQTQSGKSSVFLENTLAGGNSFSSTSRYIECLNKFIYESNI